MNLIRAGKTYVNMDRVTHVCDLSTRDGGGRLVEGLLRIEFDGGGRIEVAGDSGAVLAWLDQQSTHLPPPDTP
jgi:hypothetical protein